MPCLPGHGQKTFPKNKAVQGPGDRCWSALALALSALYPPIGPGVRSWVSWSCLSRQPPPPPGQGRPRLEIQSDPGDGPPGVTEGGGQEDGVGGMEEWLEGGPDRTTGREREQRGRQGLSAAWGGTVAGIARCQNGLPENGLAAPPPSPMADMACAPPPVVGEEDSPTQSGPGLKKTLRDHWTEIFTSCRTAASPGNPSPKMQP